MSRAADEQFDGKRTVSDDYEEITIPKGTKLYRLDMKGDDKGAWYVTEDQAKDYITVDEDGQKHFDAERYCEDAQIELYNGSEDVTYKNHVSVYEAKEDIHAEKGIADENYANGRGGVEQVYIPEEERDKLERVEGEDYEVDNRTGYSSEQAYEMHSHAGEVSAVTKGQVSDEQLEWINEYDDKELDRENVDFNLSSEDLEDIRDSELYSRYKIGESLRANEEADKYDTTDNWQ